MQKIDWVRKLTSRKFWLAIASFVGMLVSAFGMAETDVTQITSLILAGATVIAYIIGEGLTDAANAESTAIDTVKYSDGTEVKMRAIEADEGVYNELNAE